MYADTITLFNRKESRSGDTWYPSVLHNVHLNMDRAAILAKYGAESQDSAALNVRYALSDGDKLIGDKIWLPPKEWDALEDPSGHITFNGGETFDFFWLGEWENEKPISSMDYSADNGFYNYMNRTHDYVFAVSSVGGPYSVIPHFEIMGR